MKTTAVGTQAEQIHTDITDNSNSAYNGYFYGSTESGYLGRYRVAGAYPKSAREAFEAAYATYTSAGSSDETDAAMQTAIDNFNSSRMPYYANAMVRIRSLSENTLYVKDNNSVKYETTNTANLTTASTDSSDINTIFFYCGEGGSASTVTDGLGTDVLADGYSNLYLINYGTGHYVMGPGYDRWQTKYGDATYNGHRSAFADSASTSTQRMCIPATTWGYPHFVTIAKSNDQKPGHSKLGWGYKKDEFHAYVKGGAFLSDQFDYHRYGETTASVMEGTTNYSYPTLSQRNTNEGFASDTLANDAHRFIIEYVENLPVKVGTSGYMGMITPVPLHNWPSSVTVYKLSSATDAINVPDNTGNTTSDRDGSVTWTSVSSTDGVSANDFIFIDAGGLGSQTILFPIDFSKLSTNTYGQNTYTSVDNGIATTTNVATTAICANLNTISGLDNYIKARACAASNENADAKTYVLFTLGFSTLPKTDRNNYKFYRFTGTYVPNNRMFLRMSKDTFDKFVSTSGSSTGAKLNMVFDNGTATGVTDIEKDIRRINLLAPVYDLNGRLVSAGGDADALPKGVYIRSGKKFVVK